MIPILNSIKAIEKQYETGELPVLVACSDRNLYICKYMRSSGSAFKLSCELIGALLVKIWDIESPSCSFIQIKPEHWTGISTPHNLSAPSFGYQQLNRIIDITPSTYTTVGQNRSLLRQLLKIALFDFWIANEDRTCNNANLLYDMQRQKLISIDYGGIFNTSTFDFPLSQLTYTDTILYADLFQHLSNRETTDTIKNMAAELFSYYEECIKQSCKKAEEIIKSVPIEWKVPTPMIEAKVKQLFEPEWIAGVWENFIDCVNENIRKD